ncbi:MAG TPA: FAD-dependent oxidoreductase [Dermatophilaceae bacterium]|nr:FAD-dependent oxidoreductase [Dermatophilaceae bacterium]
MDQRAREVHTSLWWGRRGRPAEPWEAPDRGPLPSTGEVHDVVVVGAGLTGLTTAVLLARGGVRPLVLEGRYAGSGTTGHSTAKLSVLQGSIYSGIRSHFGDDAVRAYGQAQRAGQGWLLAFCATAGVPVQHRDAWTYAVTGKGAKKVAAERRACAAAGLAVEETSATELPFDVRSAIRMPEQAQFDPVEVVAALRAELESLGGTVLEGVQVTGVSIGSGDGDAREPATLRTRRGDVLGRRVVLATGMPVLDRGLYFAKLKPERSYALAYRVPEGDGPLPQGMYLSVDSPSRSLRTAPGGAGGGAGAGGAGADGEELLVVGGNGHVVGRRGSPREAVADLDAWTRASFPGSELVFSWAAQDYETANQVPFVGVMPRSNGQLFLATGFHKWGMTNAAAAGLMLSADLLGEGAAQDIGWARPLRHRMTSPRDLANGIEFNGTVGLRMARDWAARAIPFGRRDTPAEGEGFVERGSMPPTGVCTVAGVTHRVDAVCPHLAGILSWNDSDLSWDCPLHGSRFTADGHRIEGPALRNLDQR